MIRTMHLIWRPVNYTLARRSLKRSQLVLGTQLVFGSGLGLWPGLFSPRWTSAQPQHIRIFISIKNLILVIPPSHRPTSQSRTYPLSTEWSMQRTNPLHFTNPFVWKSTNLLKVPNPTRQVLPVRLPANWDRRHWHLPCFDGSTPYFITVLHI